MNTRKQNKEFNGWRAPDFFIIGAPKCGTSSLAAYLSEHPKILLSHPKEPHYFSTDMKLSWVSNLEDYKKCFHYKKNDYQSIGEASVFYLFSKEAVPNILKCNPRAKFIVMIRNPIELCHSLHAQLLFDSDENESNFRKAWKLQEARSVGESVPRLCKDPSILQYRKVCSLGEQLELLYSRVPKDNVYIILMDDLKRDVSNIYKNTLRFLGVEFDGRTEFPIVNENKIARSRFITNTIRTFAEIKLLLRLPRTGIRLTDRLIGINKKNQAREPLSNEMFCILADEFRDDIDKLSKLIDRDLSDWLQI